MELIEKLKVLITRGDFDSEFEALLAEISLHLEQKKIATDIVAIKHKEVTMTILKLQNVGIPQNLLMRLASLIESILRMIYEALGTKPQ